MLITYDTATQIVEQLNFTSTHYKMKRKKKNFNIKTKFVPSMLLLKIVTAILKRADTSKHNSHVVWKLMCKIIVTSLQPTRTL